MNGGEPDGYKRIVAGGKRYYGKHLILCGRGCSGRLLEKAEVAAFLKDMVRRIGMQAFGEPIVERFGEGIEVGISGVQLISTSAITVHTNDGARDLYLDVFSCKDFDERQAEALVRERFAPRELEREVFLRR